MIKLRYVFLFLLSAILVTSPRSARARWLGPAEVLTSTWGSGVGQLGIEYGDSGDDFPRFFGVSKNGYIVIADPINEVLHEFDNGGTYLRGIKSPLKWSGWPYKVIVGGECAVVGYVEFTHTFDILTGNLIGNVSNMGAAKYISADCSKIYAGGRNGWKIYSPTGQLLKTTAERPLELGWVKEKSLGDGNFKIAINYDDSNYTFISDRDYERYLRDKGKNVYGVLPGLVDKFSTCGKRLGRLVLPDNMEFKGEEIPGEEQYVFTHDEYGEPVLDINGNVYTWKKSPSKYSILKWTWQDDPDAPADLPDAPTNLTVATGANGLTLRWKAPLQDPGCVSEYEIARSAVSGGAFTPVGTAPSGTFTYTDTTAEAGLTYYYKVRAKGGSGYSDYTNEASGQY